VHVKLKLEEEKKEKLHWEKNNTGTVVSKLLSFKK